MQNLKGKILHSTTALDDTFFERTVIFITEHNQEGATGFVTNKLFPRKLNELEEFKHLAAIDLYDGGPVDREHIFFLHRSSNITAGTSIIDNIVFGGDFKKAVELLTNGSISATAIKIFIGYCGWNAGELEFEIKEGSWQVSEAATEIIFDIHK